MNNKISIPSQSLEDLLSSKNQSSFPGYPGFLLVKEIEFGRVRFVSPEVKDVIGISAERILHEGDDLIFKKVWKKEIAFVFEKLHWIEEIFRNKRQHTLNDRSFNLSYRLVGTYGNLQHILQFNKIGKFDSRGKPMNIERRFLDISSLQIDPSEKQTVFYIFNLKSNHLEITQKKEIVQPYQMLSKREKEVDFLVNNGLNTLSIAT